MIPVGEPYRPAGTFDAKSILITTILGTTAGMIGAALVWLWERSPIPTLVLLTPMIQGAGVGLVMTFAIGRLRLRNPWIVGVVGFACGLLSAVLVHYGHYLNMATEIAAEARSQISQDKTIPEGERTSLLAKLDADPAAFGEAMIVNQTQHSGFLGSLLLRNEQGVTIKSSVVTGTFLWILWGGEALAVAVIASMMAAGRAAAPFCEDCGYWCDSHPDLLTLGGSSGAPLVEAIRNDSPSQIAALRAVPWVDDGSGSVSVSLTACPGCDQSFADVKHQVKKRKETKVKSLLAQLRVSPEVAHAIRFAPEPAEAGHDEAPEKGEAKLAEGWEAE
jgi:hypothetical protein